jgi:hypothetical protein
LSAPVGLGFAALTGWVQIMFRDLHLALLAAMAFALFLALVWPRHPWGWALLIGIAPATAEFYLIARGQPIERGHVEVAFAAILPATVGAYGGHFMRLMVGRLFEKPLQPEAAEKVERGASAGKGAV